MNKPFAFDFHIHSKYSYDSVLSPSQIIKMAKKVGLKGIAITDHNTIRGGMEAKRIADDSIYVIVGSEIKTNRGDLIGLFLSNEIKSRDFNRVINEIRKQDGIAILPHPYKLGKYDIKKLGQKVDIIEVKNGRLPTYKNIMARKLARSLNKPIIGGSDAHISAEIGCIKTYFQAKVISEQSLKEMLLNSKRTVIGKESPRWVHYISSAIGTARTCEFNGLFRAIIGQINESKSE